MVSETVEEERYIRWADLMRKIHGLEVLDCPCGGKRKVVALVRDQEEIRATLARLGLPCLRLEFAKSRPQAQRFAFQRHSDFDGLDPPAPD